MYPLAIQKIVAAEPRMEHIALTTMTIPSQKFYLLVHLLLLIHLYQSFLSK